MLMMELQYGNNVNYITMKKYFQPLMFIAVLMAMASCSSSDDVVAENNNAEGKLVSMTFTATQESNDGTRTALDNSNSVIWKSGDEISVFDGTDNQKFTLSSTEGTTTGDFSGSASSTATSYTAVYPYTSGATLGEDGNVNGITLPAEQTATLNSFDPAAALMMAVSTEGNKNKLEFKNAVSLVKVTTKFACKKIVVSANENIAGTGTLSYNSGEPSISFTSETSNSITLKPVTGETEIAVGTYYIVIPAGILTDFSISFSASNEYNIYTRTATKSNTFARSKIKNLGEFATAGTWTHTSRGSIVTAGQEVDMGEFTIDGKKYRVIFAKSNLTTTGLAANSTDYGDYFAWGATEPWYTSYSGSTFDGWKDDKTEGYKSVNTPYYDSGTSTCTKYTTSGDVLEAEDDAARKILSGDWQIPTQEIWQALVLNSTKTRDNTNGGYNFVKNGQTLFLPAAGYVFGSSCYDVGSEGNYWSGTAYSNIFAYYLYFNNGNVNAEYYNRYFGFSVRPVRLVAVE